MCSFWQDNWFNIVSIFLSGIISWIITAIYFVRANRKEAMLLVVHPFTLLIERFPNKCDENTLREIFDTPIRKHISNNLLKKMNVLFDLYLKISGSDTTQLEASAIHNHFFNVLDKHKINYKLDQVVDNEGEIADYCTISDLKYIDTDIKKLIVDSDIYDLDNDGKYHINILLNSYLNDFVTDTQLDFFKEKNVTQVIDADAKYIEYKSMVNEYNNAKSSYFNFKQILNLKKMH